MAIVTISESGRHLTPEACTRLLTWLFTNDSVVQPTDPFTMRLMSAMGDSVTPGTEVTGDSYARHSFTYGVAAVVGTPRARYPGADTSLGIVDTVSGTTIAGVEIWDSAGTPVRLMEAPNALSAFTLDAGDDLNLTADSHGMGVAAVGVPCLTNAAALRGLDFLTGRSGLTRPTAPFTMKLTLKNTSSAASAGTVISSDSDVDLYAAATGVEFTVADVSGTIYATNDADIEFAGISSTKGWVVWGWEIWDDAGFRVAWQQLPTGYVVYPGETIKIPAGSLQVAAQ
jgi:hypothetical protein